MWGEGLFVGSRPRAPSMKAACCTCRGMTPTMSTPHQYCMANTSHATKQRSVPQMQVLSDEEKRERWDAGDDVEVQEGHGGHGNPFWHMQQGGAQFHFQWEH